jgi:hypothetical protein
VVNLTRFYRNKNFSKMNRRKLISLSREPRFLVISSVALVVGAVILSNIISFLALKKKHAARHAAKDRTLVLSFDSLVSANRRQDFFNSKPPTDFRAVDFPGLEHPLATESYDDLKKQISRSTEITALPITWRRSMETRPPAPPRSASWKSFPKICDIEMSFWVMRILPPNNLRKESPPIFKRANYSPKPFTASAPHSLR